ncbi:Pkinase-domain-containing protein [Lichtheimia hyalospora FSU 10163]|nr:Pkinase-domain-containing protein [Lichtheimia hyalospora FSU 10163]
MGLFSALNTLAHGAQPDSYIRKKSYEFEKELGRGSFGSVKQATRLSDGLPVAIKVIPKRLVKGHFDLVLSEVNVLKDLTHPNIIRLHETFESRDKFYMVFELATGGELFERLLEFGKIAEKDAIGIVRSVLHGLQYLHSKNIVHRDIKPENLLFKNQSPNAELVICDFGIAKKLTDPPSSVLDTLCGSPLYVAPEVLERKAYGCPVDIWAMGVITYMTLCGYQPFQGGKDQKDQKELNAQITNAKYEFHERYWQNISQDAKDFIQQLLSLDPSKRPTATEALKHPWLTNDANALPAESVNDKQTAQQSAKPSPAADTTAQAAASS